MYSEPPDDPDDPDDDPLIVVEDGNRRRRMPRSVVSRILAGLGVAVSALVTAFEELKADRVKRTLTQVEKDRQTSATQSLSKIRKPTQ